MKFLKTSLNLSLLLLAFVFGQSQNVDLASGGFEKLKVERTINIEFNWDKFGVGEFGKEAQYIKYKKDQFKDKEPGEADKWEKDWNEAKMGRYAPKFIELFTKHAEMTYDSTAKYTLIFKTSFIEPGYQAGVSKKTGQVEGQIWLVETANKTKKIAVIGVERAENSMFKGAHFDWASRIEEAYATTGKKAGMMVKKELGKKEEK